MLMRCHTTSAQALYQVFISPSTSFRVPLCHSQAVSQPIRHVGPFKAQRRALSKYRKVTAETNISILKDPAHPVNEDIQSPIVHLSKDGKLHSNQTLRSLVWEAKALTEKSKKDGAAQYHDTFHVRQYAVHGDGSPVVRFVTERELWEQAKLQKVKPKTAEERSKQLELNWALDQQDLQHRLVRLQSFLREGRRVEVLLGNKKGGRRATTQEMETLLDQIYKGAKDVAGVQEIKPMEGHIGGRAVITLGMNETVRAQLPTNKGEGDESKEYKKAKREREKEERRVKEAERQRRAEVRVMELEKQRTVKIEDLQ